MRDVFLDTVGLLAILNVDDQWHAAAEPAYQQIKADGRDFLATTLIFAEAGNAAARTHFRQLLCDIRRTMTERGQIETPTLQDWEQAWMLYERDHASRAGIVDYVSFAVMRRLGLADVFSNDQHFAAAGFQTLF